MSITGNVELRLHITFTLAIRKQEDQSHMTILQEYIHETIYPIAYDLDEILHPTEVNMHGEYAMVLDDTRHRFIYDAMIDTELPYEVEKQPIIHNKLQRAISSKYFDQNVSHSWKDELIKRIKMFPHPNVGFIDLEITEISSMKVVSVDV